MAAATTLQYRRPGAPEAARLSFLTAIRKRELAYQAAAGSMLLAGCTALLLGLALLTSFITQIESRIAPHREISWWAQVGLIAAVLVPLLFWWERRTRGRWFEDEVRSQGTTPADLWQSSSYGEWELRTTAASWAAFGEVLLWGPRMILAARARRRQQHSAALLTEAASIVHYLRYFDGGITVAELPAAQPQAVLRYLVSRQWVGVSGDNQRVWLLSDARRALVLPPGA